MKRLILVILLALLTFLEVKAQSLDLISVDNTLYPTMKAKFYAYDVYGNSINYFNLSDFLITENDSTRQILSVVCPPIISPPVISSVLVMDISASMTDDNNLNLNLAKAGATEWVNSLSSSTFQCAITAFNWYNYLIQDFTDDIMLLRDDISKLTPFDGTNYDAALIEPAAGGILIAKTGLYKKVIIMLTDGKSYFNDRQDIISQALSNNITIYCVVLGLPAPQCLKDVSTKTGGKYYENVTSTDAIRAIYKEIYNLSRDHDPCEISWLSESNCETNTFLTKINLLENNTSSTFSYQSPISNLPQLVFGNKIKYIVFNNVLPGDYKDSTITLKAYNGDFNVSDIQTSNSSFTITPTSFFLRQGDSIKLKITFSPTDSSYTYSKFSFISQPCTTDFYVYGGYIGKKSKIIDTLVLTFPNGGETFLVGNDTVITWRGIPPVERVKLEYSTDRGLSWLFVTDTATGLLYPWKNIPNTPSKLCLMKATELAQSNYESFSLISTLPTLVNNRINNLCWSPDGSRVASICTNNVAKIWFAENGANLFTLSEHSDQINDISWSSDGLYIATASADTKAIIWDASAGAYIESLEGHGLAINKVKWSPDNTKLATASADRTARVWDRSTGLVVYTLKGHGANVVDLSWSPDGNFLATTSTDGYVRIWDMESGLIITTIPGATYAFCPAWNPNSDKIAVPALNNTARIYNSKNGQLIQTFIGHTADIHDVKWSPDGTRIATSGLDKCVKIWNVASGSMIHNRWGHTGPINIVQWSPDGGLLAGSSNDSTIVVWDSTSASFMRTLTGHNASVQNIEWNFDGTNLASASLDGTVKIWHISNLPMQHDISDSIWSIVKPEITSKDIDMGMVATGSNKDSIVTSFIVNKSKYPCKIDTMYFAGEYPDNFSFVSENSDFVVGKNSTESLEVVFTPGNIVGTLSAIIVIITQADTIIQHIKGTGVQAQVTILTKMIDFGKVKLGNYKDTLSVKTIQNSGNNDLYFSSSYFLNNNNNFIELDGNAPFTLKPEDTSTMSFRFTPQKVGRTNAYLFLINNGVSSPTVIQLFGEGYKNNPIIHCSDLNFNILTCENYKDTCITISNTGTDTLFISDMFLNGKDSTDFMFLNKYNLPIIIAPDSSIKYNVRFLPKDHGLKQSNIIITSNSVSNSNLTLILSGEKDSISVKSNIDEVNFGIINYNQYIDSLIVIENTGNITADIILTATGDVKLNKYHIKIPAVEKDTVMVYYIGSVIDTILNEKLNIFEKTCNQSIDVGLKLIIKGNNNTYPIIQANGIDFSSIICDNFKDSIITISNIGDDTLYISKINLKGTNFDNFKILDVLSYPIEIIPESSKTISIRFNSNSSGAKNAYLEIISNSKTDSVFNITITGQKDSINIMSNINKIDLGYICPNETKDTLINFINYGTLKTEIYLSSSSKLSLTSKSMVVDAGSSKALKFTINDISNNDSINETITYSDSVCYNTGKIYITGKAITPVIITNNLKFVTSIGKQVQDSLIIKNTGLQDVLLTKQTTIDLPFKIINNLFPLTIKANDSIKLYFEFIPTDTLLHQLNLELLGEPCAISNEVSLTGSASTAYATLQVCSKNGYPGEMIEIPIKAINLRNLSKDGITGFNVDLSYNSTLLSAIDEIQTIQSDGTAKITLNNLEINNIKNDIITKVKFNVGLGNSESSDLILSNPEAIGGYATISTINGQLNLLGVCYQGGARLINPNSKVQLNVLNSNPANSNLKIYYSLIENGNTKLYIVNTLGICVKSILNEENNVGYYTKEISTSDIATGTYLIILETPTTIKSAYVIIIK